MKKILIYLIYGISILVTTYLIITLIYLSIPHKGQIIINKNKQKEIIEYLKEEYDEPERVTKIRVKTMLGDAKLYLYSGRKVVKETTVSEGNEIWEYILEHEKDINIDIKYVIYTIIAICITIGIFYYKEKNLKK